MRVVDNTLFKHFVCLLAEKARVCS